MQLGPFNQAAEDTGVAGFGEPSAGARQKLLVTGASGFLGSEICYQAASAYEVYALSHERAVPDTLAAWRSRIDLCDADMLSALFHQFKPQLVVHCAAMSSPEACEEDPVASELINIQSTRLLAALCAETGCRLIFTSTDLVYDGLLGHYDETAQPRPVNTYGRHKVEAEQAVKASGCHGIICRLPLLFGHGRLQPSPMERTLERWAAGETVTGFSDEYRSTISYAAAARGLLQLAESVPRHQMQLLHLGGLQTVSRFEFLQALAERLQHYCEQRVDATDNHRRPAHPTLVSAAASAMAYTKSGLREQARLLAARPADVSLDSRAAREFDLRMPFLDNQLDAALNCYDEAYHQKR
ncbi:NAD(P)-dependent oxidoreductase [Allohahella marinimesophila]|uniref:SDR family oxidoreductase n=1 Tax=Allohahella marinimesophila TaxID=1054972 RepID=A0ABP7P9S4_9GAMM